MSHVHHARTGYEYRHGHPSSDDLAGTEHAPDHTHAEPKIPMLMHRHAASYQPEVWPDSKNKGSHMHPDGTLGPDHPDLWNNWNDGEPVPGRFTKPPKVLRLGPPKQSPVVDPYE